MNSKNKKHITDNKRKIIFGLPVFYSLLFVICFMLFVVSPVSAASSNQGIGCGGGMGLIADLLCGLTGDKTADAKVIGKETNSVLSGVIGFLTVVAGLYFGIQMILGGFDWIGSSGDKGKLETARNKIIYAILGMTIVVASYVIIGLVATMLGVNILNPGQLLINMLK